jgi:hypothetical protein
LISPAAVCSLSLQMGVHCGELCKCSDCQNIDNGDGTAVPGSAAKGNARGNARATSTSSQQRLQHTANLATLGGYWSLGQQQLGSAVSSGTGTPVAAAAAAAASSAGFGAMAGLSAQAGQTSECFLLLLLLLPCVLAVRLNVTKTVLFLCMCITYVCRQASVLLVPTFAPMPVSHPVIQLMYAVTDCTGD